MDFPSSFILAIYPSPSSQTTPQCHFVGRRTTTTDSHTKCGTLSQLNGLAERGETDHETHFVVHSEEEEDLMPQQQYWPPTLTLNDEEADDADDGDKESFAVNVYLLIKCKYFVLMLMAGLLLVEPPTP